MRKHLSSIILALIFLIGLSLLLYPTVSDYWNSLHQSRAIKGYQEEVESMDKEEIARLWESAEAYNEKLAQKKQSFSLNTEEIEDYNSQLSVTEKGIMASIEIPKINCKLPIYHGTEDEVLQVAVGHLPGSSLPVGGESSHCVLTGHRGLPSAQLFSKLDQLEEGDIFILETLGQKLTYQVDQISIVLPSEIDSLRIVEGEDLCTLVTCTPYGVNTHRLLVRGHRISNETAGQINVTADAYQIPPIMIAPLFAAILLGLLFIGLYFRSRKKKEVREKND